MKTKMKIWSWFLIGILAFIAIDGMALNQDTTQVVCKGVHPYSVDPIAGATFTWGLPDGGGTISGNGNSSITVDWTTAGLYRLTVFATKDGCDGPQQHMWVTVVETPVAPSLINKFPDVASVCSGTKVGAYIAPGSGGYNCTDEIQYSYDGLGGWLTYTSGDSIPTVGHTSVDIRARRVCDTTGGGCPGSEWQTLASWTITTALPVSVTISADPNPVCEGLAVTLTAQVVNGGTTPIYEWFVNGNPAGTNNYQYTYVPSNGDIVTCRVTSSETCGTGNPATSEPVTVVVKPKPVTSPIWHN